MAVVAQRLEHPAVAREKRVQLPSTAQPTLKLRLAFAVLFLYYYIYEWEY